MNPVARRWATANPVMGEHQMGIHTTTRHPATISVPPGTILGYRTDGRPIHIIAGGAEDDDPDIVIDDDPEPEPADDPEPEPDDDPEPDPAPKPKPPAKKDDPELWKPPTESEWRRTTAALKKSNEDGKRHRLRNKELEDAARANETDHEKALREAREEGEKRFREPMKKSGVRAALAEAGFTAPDRLMKLIDWDAITVDEDGDLIGAEAEVDRVKAEYPELLPQEKPKPKPRPTGAPKPAATDKPKNSWEIHAARVLGNS
ncbi:phage scaffolding protein [Streptomyces sp. NPDC058464]|uniref:phage scaffolding protein n=1 Tax=Streptomyces sp. NPDC058464 TaxID=3346511 RepID=UPI00364DD3A8